jgi:hypothetical protein
VDCDSNLFGGMSQVNITVTRNNQKRVFRDVFDMLQESVIRKWPESERVRYTTPSGFVFLRFFCPAILNPKQHGVMEGKCIKDDFRVTVADYPKPIAARNLTLISKTSNHNAFLTLILCSYESC